MLLLLIQWQLTADPVILHIEKEWINNDVWQ